MQTLYASVGRVGATLDQSARFQPIHQPAHRDRLHFAQRRHLVLRETRLTLQTGQNDHLSPSHPIIAGPLVEACALHPRHIVELNQHVAIETLHDENISHVIITCKTLSLDTIPPKMPPRLEKNGP